MHAGKKVSILGLGETGYQSALFLSARGYDVFVTEKQETERHRERARELKNRGIACETGGHDLARMLACDWFLISPGIGPAAEIYRAATESGRPVYSEIEAASWFCPSGRIIAVTGSCGKTTVSTLLHRALEAAGERAVLCGNIGNPWIGELGRIDQETTVVLELSSFQLQHCEKFRPRLAIVLNLYPNHLDWHRDMQEYADAKWRIFRNQTEGDTAMFRGRDLRAWPPGFEIRAAAVDLDRLPPGNPNQETVREAGRRWGLPSEAIEKVLAGFRGLEHRMEEVKELNGVRFINDSKSTTTASLAWALEKMPERKVLLIAGGIAKSKDFSTIRELIARKARRVFLIGKSGPLLKESWQGAAPITEAGGLEEAVQKAGACAEPGDVVLLSPACASFDMFTSYQHRGSEFKRIVGGLCFSRREPAQGKT